MAKKGPIWLPLLSSACVFHLATGILRRCTEPLPEPHTRTLMMSLRFSHYRLQMMMCWARGVPMLVNANISLEAIMQRGFQLTLSSYVTILCVASAWEMLQSYKDKSLLSVFSFDFNFLTQMTNPKQLSLSVIITIHIHSEHSNVFSSWLWHVYSVRGH